MIFPEILQPAIAEILTGAEFTVLHEFEQPQTCLENYSAQRFAFLHSLGAELTGACRHPATGVMRFELDTRVLLRLYSPRGNVPDSADFSSRCRTVMEGLLLGNLDATGVSLDKTGFSTVHKRLFAEMTLRLKTTFMEPYQPVGGNGND